MTSVPVPGVPGSVPSVQPPPTLAGLSPEVLTVSSLLSMPAVWNAVVQRALPINVLLERYLVVLLTCALVAELVRRLGEGGALGPASPNSPTSLAAEDAPAPRPAASTASPALFDEPATGLDDLTGFDDLGDLDAAPLALDAPASDLSDLSDLGDLAPLDLDADPFAEPA